MCGIGRQVTRPDSLHPASIELDGMARHIVDSIRGLLMMDSEAPSDSAYHGRGHHRPRGHQRAPDRGTPMGGMP